MGKLIAVVGNTGVGKTTLVRRLAQEIDFTTGLEQHTERPFQTLFARHGRAYAFPNQIDYLLFRAEQEQVIRGSPLPGLVDGGLEMDFFVFTRRFWDLGYLALDEYQLCKRLYTTLRSVLPLPDVILYLHAPLEVIEARFVRRSRLVEISALTDLAALQTLLDTWINTVTSIPILKVDASRFDPTYSTCFPGLLEALAPYIT